MASTSVFLNVRDIEKSLSFYRALGFHVEAQHRDEETGETAWADLSLEGADLGLGSIGSNDDEEFQQWVSTPLGAGVVVYLSVENVDRYHRAAQDVGAVIEQPITDRPYGRLFTLNDPDGYTITFIREPPAKKAPRKAGKAAPKKAARKGAAKPAAKKAAPRKAAKASKKAAPKAAGTARKASGKATAKKAAGRGAKAARGASAKRARR